MNNNRATKEEIYKLFGDLYETRLEKNTFVICRNSQRNDDGDDEDGDDGYADNGGIHGANL